MSTQNKKSGPPEFPITVNDEAEYPGGRIRLNHGAYGHLEFELDDEQEFSGGLIVGTHQQLGFIMARHDALAFARAIREHYGIKDEESPGA